MFCACKKMQENNIVQLFLRWIYFIQESHSNVYHSVNGSQLAKMKKSIPDMCLP